MSYIISAFIFLFALTQIECQEVVIHQNEMSTSLTNEVISLVTLLTQRLDHHISLWNNYDIISANITEHFGKLYSGKWEAIVGKDIHVGDKLQHQTGFFISLTVREINITIIKVVSLYIL